MKTRDFFSDNLDWFASLAAFKWDASEAQCLCQASVLPPATSQALSELSEAARAEVYLIVQRHKDACAAQGVPLEDERTVWRDAIEMVKSGIGLAPDHDRNAVEYPRTSYSVYQSPKGI